jgi:hypothetical protein
MTRRRWRGYSIVEALVVIALVGLVTMTVGGLLPAVWRETKRCAAEEDLFERKWLAAARLRSDVERAFRAEAGGTSLRLVGAHGSVDWSVEKGGLVRRSTTEGLPGTPGRILERRFPLGRSSGLPPAELAVMDHPGGAVVRWRIGVGRGAIPGRAVVGVAAEEERR